MNSLRDLGQSLEQICFSGRMISTLLVIDYFSRFVKITKLSSTTAACVVTHLKSMFARHGIPTEVISDNGPQFSAKYFRKFAKEWGFSHTTSSPRYPQANGEAERAVRTVKDFLSNTADPYLAPMEYKATPFANGYSPAELLIGRKLCTIQSLSYHQC